VKTLPLLCAGILVAFACIALGDDAKKDETKIDGTWVLKTAELAGKELPKQAGATATLTLKNGKYEFQAESLDRGTVTYNDSATPKEMDIKGVEGPNRGKTFLAIYELARDKLTVCYDLSGKSRPTEFKTRPKSQLFLATYERKKPDGEKAR
jgi:uncharacterized protein (TIGR03067 family)